MCASGFVLIPGLPLLKVILISQVANGVLLPFVLTFMLMLVNRPRLMGDWKNGVWANAIAGTTSVVMSRPDRHDGVESRCTEVEPFPAACDNTGVPKWQISRHSSARYPTFPSPASSFTTSRLS